MKILVVDDDVSFNELVADYLKRQGYKAVSVYSAKAALEALAKNKFELVLSDYKLPGLDGLDLIERIKSTYPGLPVILITNYADIRVAVNSIKLGAFEFVTKPIIPDELLKVINLALSTGTEKDQDEIGHQKKKVSENYVLGKNAENDQLWKHLTIVAPTKMNVLILGESGTGKEHIARTIHHLSRRKKKPFVAVDCGSLSTELAGSELFGHIKGAFTGANSDKQGLFEDANGGTLFLDEVGNLPHEIQVLLLRALQEGSIKKVGGNQEIKIDVRFVAATNEKLIAGAENEGFRNDLYHRLNEFELQVPPLRERLDDLEEFCEFFIEQASTELQKAPIAISDEVLNIFKRYSWPGNLRELKNIIRRSVLLTSGDLMKEDSLPPFLKQRHLGDTQSEIPDQKNPLFPPAELNIKENNKEQEKQLIIDALKKYKYNKSKAAVALNIDRSTLYKKIKQFKIDS